MKRVFFIVVVFALSSLAASQTLADRARAARKGKPAASSRQVITNESISMTRPADETPAASGETAAKDGTKTADAKTADGQPAEGAAKEGDKAAAGSEEEKKKAAEEWKGKIEKQKAEVATLKRELDIYTREAKLRAAAFYGDAGNKLRNETAYAEEERKTQATLADKQKAIAAAEAALEKMRDDARRAGVPPGQLN